MIYFAIRHKDTGELMPEVKHRGYSHWNPSTGKVPDTITGCPRLFAKRRSAIYSIAQWAANPNSREHFSRDWETGYPEVDITCKPDGRKKEDLEVIQIELTIK